MEWLRTAVQQQQQQQQQQQPQPQPQQPQQQQQQQQQQAVVSAAAAPVANSTLDAAAQALIEKLASEAPPGIPDSNAGADAAGDTGNVDDGGGGGSGGGGGDDGRVFFLVQHHPFHNRDVFGGATGLNRVKNFTFDAYQDAQVQAALEAGGKRVAGDYLGVAAGHMHRWRRNASAFTPDTAPPSLDNPLASGEPSAWLGLREFETSASKGWCADEEFTSAITVFTFQQEEEEGPASNLGYVLGSATAAAPAPTGASPKPSLVKAEGLWLTPNAAWAPPPVYKFVV
jgi:hypothetical protein